MNLRMVEVHDFSKNKLTKNHYKLLMKEDISSLLVDENIDYVLRELNNYLSHKAKDEVNFCDCWDCLLDITALTLNKSRSRYRLLGRHAHKEWDDVRLVCRDIEKSIKEAIAIVKARPHHE